MNREQESESLANVRARVRASGLACALTWQDTKSRRVEASKKLEIYCRPLVADNPEQQPQPKRAKLDPLPLNGKTCSEWLPLRISRWLQAHSGTGPKTSSFKFSTRTSLSQSRLEHTGFQAEVWATRAGACLTQRPRKPAACGRGPAGDSRTPLEGILSILFPRSALQLPHHGFCEIIGWAGPEGLQASQRRSLACARQPHQTGALVQTAQNWTGRVPLNRRSRGAVRRWTPDLLNSHAVEGERAQ